MAFINNLRAGNFTSSEIVKLVGIGKRLMTDEELAARPKTGEGSRTKYIESHDVLSDVAMNYIEECNMERRLNNNLDHETSAPTTDWGKLLETYVSQKHGILPTSYSINMDKTTAHLLYDMWVGTEDVTTTDAVGDIKCPYSKKSFCTLVDAMYRDDLLCGEEDEFGVWQFDGLKVINYIRKNHNDGEKYYWQLVSNACILNKKYGELIVFMPYQSELDDIRQLAGDSGEPRFQRFWSKLDSELPYLVDNGYYKNLNKIRFEIPQIDKDLLESKVKMAKQFLIPRIGR